MFDWHHRPWPAARLRDSTACEMMPRRGALQWGRVPGGLEGLSHVSPLFYVSLHQLLSALHASLFCHKKVCNRPLHTVGEHKC